MIIFEGEEVILHYHKGESDYILITFASADQTEQAYDQYFLKPVVEAYNLTCLGITTKIDNFYQHSDMMTIITLCNEISQNYKKVVLVGLCMGAYGALKFSAALRANIVFAMGARYSLDAEIVTVCGIMQRTIDRLDPYFIKETTIEPHDVSGKLYIVHDTYQGVRDYNAIDHDHAYKILSNLPNTTLVPALFSHHLVINSLKGVEEFKSILDVLVTENDQEIIHKVASVRRHHIGNIQGKTFLLRYRYPALVYKLLISKDFANVKNNFVLMDDHKNNLLLIYILSIQGFKKESRSFLKICFIRTYLNCDFYKAHLINDKQNAQIKIEYFPHLISHFGSILSYDLKQKKIIAVPQFTFGENLIPIRLYEDQNNTPKLVCVWESILFELCYTHEEVYLQALDLDEKNETAIEVEHQGDFAVLYTPDRQLCFHVDHLGDSSFKASELNGKERLAVV